MICVVEKNEQNKTSVAEEVNRNFSTKNICLLCFRAETLRLHEKTMGGETLKGFWSDITAFVSNIQGLMKQEEEQNYLFFTKFCKQIYLLQIFKEHLRNKVMFPVS